ncbi:MAG: M48 family metalloprotease [Gammaproteobacteria bacterium]|jgi:beta-barrel assembly-enhancing protease|nr:M48 family metalloprotease [Gammaproteobacteria bacterium]MBU2181375.1 M48 family metalloprotease [Gammaproteobacteria bacterium]MBU2223978.1 M48 family metalloprotease [Gammaproteobacteria bacterium]MBU2279953.1 M48 family metalloprotease [Gammaproteobacteria bacterium]MBU2427020.1 M48 family metalloprotease [Gammaproteobacteria bacterium]
MKLCAVWVCSVGLSFVLCSSVNAATPLPDLGGNAFATLTPEKEKQIGDVMMRQTRASLPMINDPLLDEYLNNLGNGLVAKAEGVRFPFQFYWVNDPNINAFATLGGNIVSNTGTLAVADSESEFASVMSHEIVHVTQRHIARSVEARSQSAPLTLASLLGSIILATVNPEAGMAGLMASQGMAQQSAINFTRSNEQEADRIGIQLLANAGFDPYAMPEFFNKLSEKTRFTNTQLAFLYTHPLSQARISDSRVRAQQYPQRFVPDSTDFPLIKARIWARYQLDTAGALDYFQKKLASPGGNTKANQYGLALAQFDNKDYAAAEQLLNKLRQDDDKNLFYLDAMTDVYLSTNRVKKALEMLEQQYLLRPNNQVITLNYANAAMQGKSHRLALHLLRNLLYYKNDNFLAYEMLVDAYKALNEMAHYYEARADLYYQLANYPKAIEDINVALNQLSAEELLEGRRLEAKKKQLQTEFSRLKKLN